MSLVVPDVGERTLLDILRATTRMLSMVCGLYQNNYTPVEGSVLASFTDATFNGYSFQSFSFGPATTVSHKGTVTAIAPCTFTCTGGAPSNTIYGYYVIDPTTAEVVWAERFSSSQTMANSGDTINVTLKFTGNSEF